VERNVEKYRDERGEDLERKGAEANALTTPLAAREASAGRLDVDGSAVLAGQVQDPAQEHLQSVNRCKLLK
jgi:hypothetical protein